MVGSAGPVNFQSLYRCKILVRSFAVKALSLNLPNWNIALLFQYSPDPLGRCK